MGTTGLASFHQLDTPGALSDRIIHRRAGLLDRLASVSRRPARQDTEGEWLTFDYALGRHTVVLMRHAQATGSGLSARRLLPHHLPDGESLPGCLPTPYGPLAVVERPDCQRVPSVDPAVPEAVVVTEDALRRSPFGHRSEFSAAIYHTIQRINDAGLGWLTERCLGALVLNQAELVTEHRAGSATDPRQPCTVFAEALAGPISFGETLVHEMAHSWLWECAAAEEVELPREPALLSPWRGCLRPASGLIHGGFAFGFVLIYYTRLLGGVLGLGERQFARTRFDEERARWLEGLPSVRESLRPMATTLTAGYVELILERAAEESAGLKL